MSECSLVFCVGLFHQAGLMSGVELALWAYFGEAYDSLYHLQQVAEHCECPTDDNQEMVNCLRLVPAEELYTKGWFNCSVSIFNLLFSPLPQLPFWESIHSLHHFCLLWNHETFHLRSFTCLIFTTLK